MKELEVQLQKFSSFFFTEIENVAVFVCDMIDERQYARKRKFDFWFNKYNDGSIIKKDNIIKIEGVEIFNSLLLSKANINFIEIVSAYNLINETSTDK